MEKLKTLYDRLFISRDVKDYLETLVEIRKAIQKVQGYKPTRLSLYSKDFPDLSCSAYICLSDFNVLSNDDRFIVSRNAVGNIVARHSHWDRDYYLSSNPIAGYVAGGPVNMEEFEKYFFPIFRQDHLRIAVKFMLEIQEQNILKRLEDEKEGFLDK